MSFTITQGAIEEVTKWLTKALTELIPYAIDQAREGKNMPSSNQIRGMLKDMKSESYYRKLYPRKKKTK